MQKVEISAIILARDEEDKIGRCIESVVFCREILVVNDFSTDNTKQIAESKGVKVIDRESKGDFSSQRNFAASIASEDWLLFVDADEVVSDELKNSIISVIGNSNRMTAYYIKRRDWFWGRELKYGETSGVRNKGIVRLLKKDTGKWTGRVHETYRPEVNTATLSGYLEHYPHQNTIAFINDINFYSTLRAGELNEINVRSGIVHIVTYPLAKFLYTYFIKFGLLDGPAGFAYSFIMSFHSFLVRAKLYQYQKIDV